MSSTETLGQGLELSRIALAAKMQKEENRCIIRRSRTWRSVYEALELASHYKLNNLCAITDVNRLGQRGETLLGHDTSAYKKDSKDLDGMQW